MMPSWGDAAVMWHESFETMEMAGEDIWQAMLLGALPVVALALALLLCQAGLLWKHDSRRELGIGADCGLGTGLRDEVEDGSGSNDNGTSDLVASSGRVSGVGGSIEQGEGGNEPEKRSSGRVLNACSRNDQESDNGVKTSCDARASDSEEQPSGRNRTRPCLQFLSRWMFLVFLCCGLALVLAQVIRLLAYLSIDSSVNKAARQTTDCKIISKGVDLRFSRICEVRPWKHKHISSTESKIWCYLDYYWASVLKVEYRPYLSELPMVAAAEAPVQALPAQCRPDFSVVWRMNEGYQVNATYPCKYNPRNLRMVDVAENITADCVPKAPPVVADLPRDFLTMVSFPSYMRRATLSAGRMVFSAALGFFAPIVMLLTARATRYICYRLQVSVRRVSQL